MRHLLHAPASRRFPPAAMQAVQQAIADGEQYHDGEISFAVEARLPLRALLAGRDVRSRAQDMFARLRVWDTPRKNGVLFYVLLADRALEIVPDELLREKMPAAAWDVIRQVIVKHFDQDDWRGGAVTGIKAAQILLARYVPVVRTSTPVL